MVPEVEMLPPLPAVPSTKNTPLLNDEVPMPKLIELAVMMVLEVFPPEIAPRDK